MNIYKDITEMIGNTPLLQLSHLAKEHQIYAKCEFMNPLSLKDRPVLQIIEDAEQDGRLKSGSTLVEATSGNTGMAVASIAAIKGYKAILVMSEIQSLERRKILQAFGAELVLTPASEGTKGARKKLKEILAENPAYFYVGQHVNPSNPKAHYRTTGPEIWNDTDGEIDLLVAALGTGGTICGAGRFLKEQNPDVKLVAVEPQESPTISQGIFCPHRMMGTAPYDGSDAVMLSAETAVGKYPTKSVEMMNKIALNVEKELHWKEFPSVKYSKEDQISETLAAAAGMIVRKIPVRAIIAFTEGGFSARLIAKHRPKTRIFVATPSVKVIRRLGLIWGCYPLLVNQYQNTDQMVVETVDRAKKMKYLKDDDTIVIVSGSVLSPGKTNLVRAYKVSDLPSPREFAAIS